MPLNEVEQCTERLRGHGLARCAETVRDVLAEIVRPQRLELDGVGLAEEGTLRSVKSIFIIRTFELAKTQLAAEPWCWISLRNTSSAFGLTMSSSWNSSKTTCTRSPGRPRSTHRDATQL